MRKHPLIAALIAVLALAGVFALGWQTRKAWHERRPDPIGMTDHPCTAQGDPMGAAAADDWAGLCIYRADNAALRAGGKTPRVVLIGDSITALWPPDPAINAANRGIGGQTSGQVLLRFRPDAIDLRPGAIHILAGINDLAGGGGPVAPDSYQGNVLAMLDLASANDIPVILGTMPPVRAFRSKPGLRPGPWVDRMNAWLRATAAAHGVELADYAAVLAAPDGSPRTDLLRDEVHPTPAGYAAMEAVLSRAIANVEASRSTPGPARR